MEKDLALTRVLLMFQVKDLQIQPTRPLQVWACPVCCPWQGQKARQWRQIRRGWDFCCNWRHDGRESADVSRWRRLPHLDCFEGFVGHKGISSMLNLHVWTHYIRYKVWDEITYPFPNFNGAAVDVWEWISNFILHFKGYMITYPCWD